MLLYRRGAVKGFRKLPFDGSSYNKRSLREVVTLQKTSRPLCPVTVADNEVCRGRGELIPWWSY